MNDFVNMFAQSMGGMGAPQQHQPANSGGHENVV
jgi:hypothetical protein